MLKTDLCRSLGIEHPVFCAGIGAAAGIELAAAVSNAGGCGVLGTASLPGRFVRAEIERLKCLTDRQFGVNRVLPLLRKGQARPAPTSRFRSWYFSGAIRRPRLTRPIDAESRCSCRSVP